MNEAEDIREEATEEIEQAEQTGQTEQEAKQDAAKREWPDQMVMLADGTEIIGSAGYDEERTVWIWFGSEAGLTMAEAFRIANNPARMETIRFLIRGNTAAEWKGFTRLKGISQTASGKINIAMEKGG